MPKKSGVSDKNVADIKLGKYKTRKYCGIFLFLFFYSFISGSYLGKGNTGGSPSTKWAVGTFGCDRSPSKFGKNMPWLAHFLESRTHCVVI